MKEDINFEDAMKELEKIAEELEKGNLSLDESVSKFEDGMKLSKKCSDLLDTAEKKITMDYFTGETTFIRTVSEIQEHIRIMVNSIRNKLTNIKIGNFKLVCNFYTWRD